MRKLEQRFRGKNVRSGVKHFTAFQKVEHDLAMSLSTDLYLSVARVRVGMMGIAVLLLSLEYLS